MRIRTWPLVAALAIAGGFGFLGGPAPAPAAESPQVFMVDNEPDLTRWHYEPAEITVPAGTTVVWRNKGKQEHSVTADDKSFDSGLKKTGETFSRAFPRPGTYAYYCAPHPWMKGKVTVIAGRTAAAADTSSSTAASSTTATAAPAPSTTAPVPPDAESPDSAASPPEDAVEAPAAEDDARAEDDAESEENAAPVRGGDDSGDDLISTLAVVLLPTLGALALGAKLRQSNA